MIRVTIELHSAQDGSRKVLGVMDITNDGISRDVNRGHYNGRVYKNGTLKPLRVGIVKDYPRLSYNVWRLVLRMLRDCFPEEKA